MLAAAEITFPGVFDDGGGGGGAADEYVALTGLVMEDEIGVADVVAVLLLLEAKALLLRLLVLTAPSCFRFLLSPGCGFRSDPRTVSLLLYDLNVTW